VKRILVLIFLLAAFSSAADWDSLQIHVGQGASASGIWSQHNKSNKKMGLMIWLHGGMQSGNCQKGFTAGKALLTYVDGSGVVVASPSVCKQNHWLTPDGLTAIESLLDSVEHRFNIDTNRITMVGVSDGGFGVLNYALNGKHKMAHHILISTFGGMFIPAEALSQVTPALSHGTWQFLQGGADGIFAAGQAKPWIETFCKTIPKASLHFEPQGEHDMAWWNTNRADLLRTTFRKN